MRTSPIHMTPEEHTAATSAAILSAVQNIPVPDSSDVIRKLDEVKSASLITNHFLKDMSKKEAPTSMEVSLKGVSVVTLKGDKGDRGVQGLKGDKGIQGEKGDKGDSGEGIEGPRGVAGKNGKDGLPGKDGKNGQDGKHGKDGKDGKDAPVYTGDQIIEELNASKKQLDPSRVKGLRDMLSTVDQIGKNPQGKLENVGGSNPLIIQDSTGTRVSDYVTVLKFSTNITPTYSGNGVVTLTASGGGGGGSVSVYSETPGGLINGSNKTYTTLNNITTVIRVTLNGEDIDPSQYSTSGSGFTMGTAIPSSFSGTPFTIVYSSGTPSSTSFYTDAVSGTINSSNTAFTVANTITTPMVLFLGGVPYQPTIDFTTSTTNITMLVAPDATLSGQPFFLLHT